MKYQELKVMAKNNGIKLSKVINNKRILLNKKELEEELNKLNKDEIKENKKELTKQIIVPKGENAVINIYMTQNNKHSHIVEEKKGVVTHHVSIPQAPPMGNIPQAPPMGNITRVQPEIIGETPEEKATRLERARLKKEEVEKEKLEMLKPKVLSREEQLVKEIKEAQEKKRIKKEEAEKKKAEEKVEGSGKYRKNLKGEGLGDWLSNLKNVLLNPNEALYKMPLHVFEQLQKYGNEQIKNIYVCREPLEAKNKLLLNIITLGGFNKASQNYGYYDDVFHLYLVFELENNKLLLVERNQRVIIKETTDAKIKIKDVIKININKKLTLNEMFKKAIIDDKKLFHYDPISHNCQNFVSILLNSSGLLNENINKFVNQDVKNLLTGYSKSIASKVIDFASLAQNIYQGGEL